MNSGYLLHISGLLLVVGSGFSWAQEPQSSEGVRQMYYFGATSTKDRLPPMRRVSAGEKTTKSGGIISQPASPDTAVRHLGLRYTLVLVDTNTNRSTPVDSSRNFKKGDCLAIEFEANRSSYLYVMNRQSDGNWIPLIPSREMQDETNILDPGQKARVPKGYCFEIKDPPGTETLLVLLSRDPRDSMQLYEGIMGPAPQRRESKSADAALLVADARQVNSAVELMSKRFGDTRNLAIRPVSQPKTPQEPPNAVYVVNVSDRPSSTLVARIEIHHR